MSMMFVCYFGDLVAHLMHGGRGGFSHPFQCFGLDRLCVRCHTEGISCDASFRKMRHKLFFSSGSWLEAYIKIRVQWTYNDIHNNHGRYIL